MESKQGLNEKCGVEIDRGASTNFGSGIVWTEFSSLGLFFFSAEWMMDYLIFFFITFEGTNEWIDHYKTEKLF